MPCSVKKESICGIETVTLESDLLRVLILTGKGSDLLEFVYKPLDINCLYRSNVPLDTYKDIDLSKERLKNHSDRSLGGWMEALPHRGVYKGLTLEQETGGIAATLPWSYEILESGSDTARVRCFVDLPLFPLHVEKIYTIRNGSLDLVIDESVTHTGDTPMNFTWTQHALFGNGFIDEETVVQTPSDTVFNAWAHIAAPDTAPERHEDPVSAARLKKGVYDLTHPLPRHYAGMEFVVFKDLNEGRAGFANKKLRLGVELLWDMAVFPCMRALYLSDGGCTVGLEPGDDLFSGLEHSLAHGTFTTLDPGECIKTAFKLSYKLLV